jgi:hypothetical protein
MAMPSPFGTDCPSCAVISTRPSPPTSAASCPWRRFQRILDAAILQADPEQAAARTLRARTEREVWAMDTEDGLKLLVASAASGDVT